MEFKELVKALGEKLGIELDGTEGACGLDVDGTTVILQDAGEMLLVRGEIGEPPPQDMESLFRAVLDANFLYQGTGGATIARSPENGLLVLQKYDWLERTDADRALATVTRFAETLAAWRRILADYRPQESSSPLSEFISDRA